MHDQPDDDAAARQLSLNETELIAPEGSNDGSAPASIEPGSLIGSYKILNKIARGGMGVVYRAEQQYPVRRIVALKVIKPGMDSEHVIARFQAERQALAVMDHPNIARVFDAGTTSAGRLYFVMEMVDGLPITAYCQKHEVSLQDRLAPFISVCHAIQHAHQKGVIHRDIKPSNILVTVYDGKPVPKVIDFGIAKAMQEPLTDGSMRT
jgi:eukaryotic-like serine/threonine-protein kinase